MASTLATNINRFALVLAALLFVALAGLWWLDRVHHWDTPHWPVSGASALLAPDSAAAAARRLVVVVNLDCSHCRTRLHEIAAARLAEREGATLGVLIVDAPGKPGRVALGVPLSGGAWWDSAGVWRGRWGRRMYGEGYVFASNGALERVIDRKDSLGVAAPR